jgi:hypothetical protein
VAALHISTTSRRSRFSTSGWRIRVVELRGIPDNTWQVHAGQLRYKEDCNSGRLVYRDTVVLALIGWLAATAGKSFSGPSPTLQAAVPAGSSSKKRFPLR